MLDETARSLWSLALDHSEHVTDLYIKYWEVYDSIPHVHQEDEYKIINYLKEQYKNKVYTR